MISTHYTPPIDLPVIRLTVKDSKLIALDWFDDKTEALLGKLSSDCPLSVVPQDALNPANADEYFAQMVIGQLDEYFVGARKVFDVALDLSTGTPFQQSVWQALLGIPYGQVISYGELACRIGKDKAFRAVGSANGKNPISLIVPCHRVIASGGGLGGYTGGLDIKKQLLKIEGVL